RRGLFTAARLGFLIVGSSAPGRGKNSRSGDTISVTQRERLFHYAMPLFPLAKLPIIPAALSAVCRFL
ncbi:hypothetical protein, partial [Escherichia coli]|uniref:hypothetical protein n=1 Tax=Escherichia coli TaxID=562 RepID=UPI002284486E